MESNETLRGVCEQALLHYGSFNQIKQCREELAELDLELNRLMIWDGVADSEKVIDELADVVIMLTQMIFIFGEEAVDKRIEFKLQRLQTRMEECSKQS